METTERFQQSAGESSFRMIDVGSKEATRRRAAARGTIRLSRDAYAAIRENKNPKGDVLAIAEVAGIQAVKRVPDTIPLCHSLPIEYARLKFEFSEARSEVTVFCEVATTAKTGVEMEALAGVNGALLTIYDLSKAVNPVLSISDIRLDVKEGGSSGRWVHPDFREEDSRLAPAAPAWRADLKNARASVLIVSDRCANGTAQDTSGAKLEAYLKAQGAQILKKTIVPDEIEKIRGQVLQLSRELGSQLLFITGGTGMSPRDVTPEALEPLWTKRVPGIGELLRSSGAQFTETAWISRSEAGMIGKTLVVLLPGSPRAVEQALGVLDPILSHILHVIEGAEGGGGSHHA